MSDRYEYDGPAELAPAIELALVKVIDPEVALNLVDVGLIYAVRVADGRVDVRMTMTSAACPVTDVIIEDVEQQLDAALPKDLLIHVELVWEPEWTPARMSNAAKFIMGW